MRAWVILMVMAVGVCVNAGLEIITYQPIVLNLTFSQAITLPKFQLLYNEIPTPYQVRQPNNTAQSCFIIDVDKQKLPVSQYLTEKYVVMFTQPLEIAGGQLSLKSFSVRAYRARNSSDYVLVPISEKKSLYPYQNFTEQTNILAIVTCALIYFIAYTTVIGLSGYNFLVVYVYISLKTQLFTSLDYKIAFYFLFDVHQAQNYSLMFQVLYLLIPHIFIIFGFAVGLIVRYTLQKQANRNIFWNYFYYYFAYRVAIITWQMASVPIFISTVHTLEQFKNNPNFYNLKIVIVYFNFIIILGFAYFAYFKSNPQLGQPIQSWISYSQTWHSQLYNGFHLGTEPKNFAKRNCKLVIYCLNMLTLLFVSVSSSQVPNIIIQLIFMLYFFVVRPFKYNFFNYFFLYMKSCIILFYLYRYIVDLYIGINEDIITSNGMTNILLVNIILVSLIVAAYCVLAIYELYQRVRVFKINHRMWGMSKYEEPEGEVRRTKKSMFEIEKQEQKKGNIETKSIMPLSSRNRRINFEDIYVNTKQIGIPKSPDKKKQRQKKSSQKKSPQKKSPQKKSPQKKSRSRNKSEKLKKSKSNESSQGKSPKQKKQIKQKQSLLKSISLEAQSPRYQ